MRILLAHALTQPLLWSDFSRMKDTWAKLKEWWAALAQRERQAVTIGSLFLLMFIIYQWIWTPYLQYVDDLRVKIGKDQKTLAWMQAADKEIKKLENQSNAKPQSVTTVALLSDMQKQIQQAGLETALTQLKQASNNTVEVHFQKVEFDKLIKMLANVVRAERVSISQLSAKIDNSPGIVNADILLKIE